MGKRWFKGLKSKPRAHKIAGFDVEGVGGEGGFVCGAIVSDDLVHFYTERQAMFEDVQALARDGYWVFSHNLQYDLPILEGLAFPVGDLLFNRYDLLWAEYPKWGRNVRIYDSGNLFPRHRVADIGEMVGYPKLELPEGIFERLARGAPWSHFLPRDQEIIRKYCVRDAEIVYMGVSMLQELVNRLGGELRATIAGTAMDLYRRKFHRYPWLVVGEETNKAARAGYYGGRVENYRVGVVEGVNAYDVTSLYPAVQRAIRFPHPNRMRLDLGTEIGREWLQGEGVVSCTVRVPNVFVPPLPCRQGGKLYFPVGEWNGVFPILELRYALEVGVELKEVDWVLWSEVTFNPFADYVETLFAKRHEYLSSGSGYANLVKLLLNSLYGRWGLDVEAGLYKLQDLTDASDLGDYQGYQTFGQDGKLLGYGRVEINREPDYVNVLFAANISGAARVHLLDELLRQGYDAVYCDTDSILTVGTVPEGEGLGGWRCEMRDGTADLIGAKEYALHSRVLGDKYVVKGVPQEVAQEYITKGAARYKRALAVREAIREGKQPAIWVETFRSAGDATLKRLVVEDVKPEDGDWRYTIPFWASDLPMVSLVGRSDRVWEGLGTDLRLPVVSLPVQAELF